MIHLKKKHSLVDRIIVIIFVTVFVLSALITAVGSKMIYDLTENDINKEVQNAARTLKSLYESDYGSSNFMELSADNFAEIINIIKCSNDIDFTLFQGDTRIFTSVRNNDGSLAVGTKAAEEVVENVLEGGQEYFYHRVMVNGEYYVGYYIPRADSSGEIVGMYFAGKPLESATANVVEAIQLFIVISAAILVVSVTFCIFYLRRIIIGMRDIKEYITKVANGDFSASISSKTVNRGDEIGDIGRHAEKLCDNLRDMIERDPLTMLYNRRSCRARLKELETERISYSIVMCDIDFFKKINDNYGHACGDAVLKKVAEILEQGVYKNNGFAARWGGEEFLLVYPEKSIDEVKVYLEMLADRLRNEEYTSGCITFRVTMTFGAVCREADEYFDDTINRADELLYKGKANGRNRIEV